MCRLRSVSYTHLDVYKRQEVIYPEKDIAERCAAKYSMDNVFDYIEISSHYGIYEISPLKEWVGKTIRESNICLLYTSRCV